jgi:cytochrome c oxidase subunit 2
MSPHNNANSKVRWGEMIVVWLVLTAIAVVGSLTIIPHLMPRPASTNMHLTILTIVVFSLLAAPVGSLVYAVAAYGLRNWNSGSGDEPPSDGPPIRGNNFITIVWIVTSTFLCVVLLVWGLAALASDNAAGAGRPTLKVDVTAQQWLWTFHYPGTSVTTQELYLPEGKTVTFDVTSVDVIHGFWILQMGVKVDANPGEVTTISVTPDKLGTFDIRCSELCGLYHAYMTAQVHVVTPSRFTSWLQAQQA